MTQLKVYKTHVNARIPERATQDSACFDLHACLSDGDRLMGFTSYNDQARIVVADSKITLLPWSRVLVPTGLIFDIPQGYSLRIHPRSGVSFKNGVTLANCEGVIDGDYVNPVFVSLINMSDSNFVIRDRDRIAQVELVRVEPWSLVESETPPPIKTSRDGGFGSTGLGANA